MRQITKTISLALVLSALLCLTSCRDGDFGKKRTASVTTAAETTASETTAPETTAHKAPVTPDAGDYGAETPEKVIIKYLDGCIRWYDDFYDYLCCVPNFVFEKMKENFIKEYSGKDEYASVSFDLENAGRRELADTVNAIYDIEGDDAKNTGNLIKSYTDFAVVSTAEYVAGDTEFDAYLGELEKYYEDADAEAFADVKVTYRAEYYGVDEVLDEDDMIVCVKINGAWYFIS